jgi:hypothetical protein
VSDDLSARVEQAITDVLADFGSEGVLVDWVVVTHQVTPGDVGAADATATSYFSSEYQPSYRTLGLLDYGRTSVIKEIQEAMEGDDL